MRKYLLLFHRWMDGENGPDEHEIKIIEASVGDLEEKIKKVTEDLNENSVCVLHQVVPL
jgi:hypothetical protein